MNSNSAWRIQCRAFVGIFVLGACVLLPAPGFAAPERVSLKTPEQKIRERQVMVATKQIRLAKIQDPEVRRAIREIFLYLNLPHVEETEEKGKRQ